MFRKRKPHIGASPGTLVIPEGAPPPTIRIMDYTSDRLEEQVIAAVSDLAPYLTSDTVTWIDVHGLGDEAVLRELAELFSLHSLLIEDVVHVPQRPKYETHEGHDLLITRMILQQDGGRIEWEQVSVIIGERYVLTFQERSGDVLDPVRERIRRGKGPMRRNGPDYLAYAIVDTVIDAYYPVLERLGDHLEAVEEEVIANPSNATIGRIHRLKRELISFRRTIWPQRDAINALIRGEENHVTDSVRIYFRDSYDHCVQLMDVIESYREMAGGLLDIYLSSLSNRMNEIMKVLTILASIFIPLTFIAGIYGMNFDNMPELHAHYGYPLALLAMAFTAAGMILFFIHKGWIAPGGGGGAPKGGPPHPDRDDEPPPELPQR